MRHLADSMIWVAATACGTKSKQSTLCISHTTLRIQARALTYMHTHTHTHTHTYTVTCTNIHAYAYAQTPTHTYTHTHTQTHLCVLWQHMQDWDDYGRQQGGHTVGGHSESGVELRKGGIGFKQAGLSAGGEAFVQTCRRCYRVGGEAYRV